MFFIDSESICKLLLATIVFLYFLWVNMTLPDWGRSVTPNLKAEYTRLPRKQTKTAERPFPLIEFNKSLAVSSHEMSSRLFKSRLCTNTCSQ